MSNKFIEKLTFDDSKIKTNSVLLVVVSAKQTFSSYIISNRIGLCSVILCQYINNVLTFISVIGS